MLTQEIKAKKTTSFNFPRGSCDTHCHVFGPSGWKHYPMDGPYQPADSPKDAMAAMHRRLGIDRVVVIQANGEPSEYASARDAIMDDPGNRRGVAVVDKTVTKDRLLEMHTSGFRGARFNYLTHLGGSPDPDTFQRVVDLIEPLGFISFPIANSGVMKVCLEPHGRSLRCEREDGSSKETIGKEAE